MKYIDHWMKGQYEWTENYEKRLIHLCNSRAQDLRKRAWDTADHRRGDFKPRTRFSNTLVTFPVKIRDYSKGLPDFQ